MATVAHRTSYVDTALNAASYTTGSFTPAADALLVVMCYAKGTTATTGLTGSANVTTFHKAVEQLGDAGGARFAIFVGNTLTGASPSSMTLNFTCTGDASTGLVLMVAEVTGMSRVGSAAVLQTVSADNNLVASSTPSVTFAAACNTNNPVIGFVGNNTNPAGLTPPTGWSEGLDTGHATPTTGAEYAFVSSGFTSTTVTWGSTSTRGAVAGIELDSSATGVNVNFSGSGTLSVALTPNKTISTNFAGTGTLSTALTPSMTVAAGFTGQGQLTATTQFILTVDANFSGTGTLAAIASPGEQSVNAFFAGSGSLTASLSPNFSVDVNLSGSGALSADVEAETTMPTFNTPEHEIGLPDKGMWSYYDTPAGLSIVRVGGVLTLHPYPENPDLLELEEGVDYFIGGHIYQVSEAVATELTNAGFGSGLS